MASRPHRRAESEALELMPASFTTSIPRLPSADGTARILVTVAPDGQVEDVRFLQGPDALRAEAETLRHVTVPATAPSPSLRLIRGGTLACATTAGICRFTLYPASVVRLPR